MCFHRASHVRTYDNGAGMNRDDLRHIFVRGFTTKSEGHARMGLHWWDNGVKSMNGKFNFIFPEPAMAVILW